MVGVAVNVTVVPGQTGLAEAAIITLTGTATHKYSYAPISIIPLILGLPARSTAGNWLLIPVVSPALMQGDVDSNCQLAVNPLYPLPVPPDGDTNKGLESMLLV